MTKIIMIQGTCSGVGKSTITTSLCRIFTNKGYKVSPFKAQNMSSNSHTFLNGDKMARSQAIQAYACNKEPDFRMNPILLVPNNGKTKVYLNGEFLENMDRFSYNDAKDEIFSKVLDSFYSLCDENDIVIIEGAGSPVELNLMQNDIVNMGFATKVSSPVILASDISRGGIFASLYGTINLLEKNQQELIKGIIVNKFKGEISYFEDGKHLIEKICNKKVLGILPHFDINLEDEDDLTDGKEMKTKESLIQNLDVEKTEENYIKYLNQQFDILAEEFSKNIDIDVIYSCMKNI